MDQQPKMHREEEEEDSLKESTGRRTEEDEPVDRREEEKKGSEEPATDQRKAAADEGEEEEERSSDGEGSMEEVAASLSLHPCSLLQYVVRAFACRLGISDPFGGTKPSGDSAPPLGPSEEGQEPDEKNPSTDNGFYIQGVITRVWAVRRRPHPRPSGPGDPVEGSGGNGGHHH